MQKIKYKTKLPKDKEESAVFRSIGIIILIFVLSVLSFVGGRIFQETTDSGLPFSLSSVLDRKEFSKDAPEDLDVGLFWEVWDTIKRSYVNVEVIDESEMYYGAIKGMVNSLGDAGTVFLTPEETELFKSQNQGKYFEGIGAELGYREGSIIIISPIEGSPAKESGVQPGDLIVKVDDYSVKQSDSIYDIVHKIRGDAGTEVVLTVLRRGEIELREIPITRGEITVPSMSLSFDEETGVSILKVGRFTEASVYAWNNVWDEKIEEFLEEGNGKLIVDLRGNPGGFFDAGVYAAEEFLPRGNVIAKQEDRSGRVQQYVVRRDGQLLDIDVVVLVNQGSASASEIFAGALQMNDRSKVVGVKTYGKGTAQSILDLRGGSSLHLTIVKWLLPDGEWLNEENVIKPDYEIELTNEDFLEGSDPQLKKALEILMK